jgi:AraC family transcriptional regulator
LRQDIKVPLLIDLKPVESLLFCSEVVAVGTFRCPSSHPLFPDSGPCSHHTFVFPRTATVIRHSGGKPFIATPNCATLYNQHQEYTRAKISDIDASDWYSVADDVLFAATGRDRPFQETHVPIDARTYMEQRRLQESLHDPLEVEERVLALLGRVIRAKPSNKTTPIMRDKVEAIKQTIASSPDSHVSLRSLSAMVDSSPFHLCRSFRDVTGMSITSYRHALRLRLALDLLRDGDLTDIALRLGYVSHSHFTSAFRRQFGMTPSQFRARS